MTFLLGGGFIFLGDVVRILIYFSFFLFSYIILLYIGLMTIHLSHTLYLSFDIYIYDDDVCCSSPISSCVVYLLSLYTCFFMYAIFISVSHKMP